MSPRSANQRARRSATSGRCGADAYGPSLTDLAPLLAATVEARKQTLLAEKPTIQRFEHANTLGYDYN